MGKLTRFGVSLDEDLLAAFDALCARKSYSNRSEALRDLIRRALGEAEWRTPDGQAAGTLTLVYDHHKHDLARRLMHLQHEDHDVIVAATHVHLDHDNCLEVLVLRAAGGDAGAGGQARLLPGRAPRRVQPGAAGPGAGLSRMAARRRQKEWFHGRRAEQDA